VDQDSLDRIRSATFPHARRGYDRREVERYLNELADWLETGGSEEARADLVAQELERIGEQVSNILGQAHDAARTMRADAEAEVRRQLAEANRKAEEIREAAERHAEETREEVDAHAIKTRSEANSQSQGVRDEAEAYSEQTRGDADAYDRQVRGEADEAVRELRAKTEKENRQATDKAQAEARRIVDEANRRKAEIEKVIGDLEKRRQSVVEELRRLASDVAGAAGAQLPTRELAPETKPSSDNGADQTAERPPPAKTETPKAREGSGPK
jgi:DivIVA domain-containing protein